MSFYGERVDVYKRNQTMQYAVVFTFFIAHAMLALQALY